ncbi:NXPE family member 4-like [Branchiostoma floridae x Branchiostoma belcheri]
MTAKTSHLVLVTSANTSSKTPHQSLVTFPNNTSKTPHQVLVTFPNTNTSKNRLQTLVTSPKNTPQEQVRPVPENHKTTKTPTHEKVSSLNNTKTKTPHHENVSSPNNTKTKTPHHENVSSPNNTKTKTPHHENVSPSNNTTTKTPHHENVSSPNNTKTKTPHHENVSPSNNTETKTPHHENASSPNNTETKTPHHENVSSPNNTETKTPHHENVSSPNNTETKTPHHENVSSPNNTETKTPHHENVSSPNNTETKTPHHENASSPNNTETKTPHHENVSSPNNTKTKTPHHENVSSSNNTKTKTPHHENGKAPKVTKIEACYLEQVTCPKNTTIVVLNRDHPYHEGDVLTVMVVARDKEGRPKTYGGDFFRARLVSSARWPHASSAGHVTDHINGTYTVQFPLYWAGGVSIKIQLVHPSEAVKVLERVREVPNKRVFHCSFVDAKTKATNTTQCFSSANSSLLLLSHQQCDFSKPEVNGTWVCEKPDKLPCSAISKCRWDSGKSRAKMLELLSEEEKKLFQKPYLEEELEVDPKEPIHVLEAEVPTPQHLPACTWDKSVALGHWSGKVWTSSVCNVRVFTQNDIRRCLANKTVYMQGDSTIRQWGQRLLTVVPLNHNKTKGYLARLEGDNSQWNISVRYRFHHFPVQGGAWCVFFDFRYVVETLDSILGGPNTIIVLSLWAHFTSEPLELLRSRLYAIRAAIHRLKRRAPGTRVFVRTGTTREHKGGKLEFYLLGSDWLAYQITEVIREMFRADPDVVVLDTWDMSVCQPGKDNVHPDQTMVDSQLNMLLSHICP